MSNPDLFLTKRIRETRSATIKLTWSSVAEDGLVPGEKGTEGEVGLPVKGVNIDIKKNVVFFPPFYDTFAAVMYYGSNDFFCITCTKK